MTLRHRMTEADAHAAAVDALTFLVQDPDRLSRFMALTGLEPATIRDAARSPDFLSAVLDHVAADEALLVACAGASGRRPEDLARAQAILSPPPPEF